MKKIIKKYGSSNVIIFTTEDMKILDASVGDILELSDIVVIKKAKIKK